MTERQSSFAKPVPLCGEHNLSRFSCGETVLDEWLRRRALDNLARGATKTYVICPIDSQQVIGFYSLCMGQVLNQEATGAMRRNMPQRIPAVILARLGVDQTWQSKQLGAALLHDAISRAARVAAEVAARLVVVHAISPAAESFYRHYGFVRLPVDSPTYALDLAKLARIS